MNRYETRFPLIPFYEQFNPNWSEEQENELQIPSSQEQNFLVLDAHEGVVVKKKPFAYYTEINFLNHGISVDVTEKKINLFVARLIKKFGVEVKDRTLITKLYRLIFNNQADFFGPNRGLFSGYFYKNDIQKTVCFLLQPHPDPLITDINVIFHLSHQHTIAICPSKQIIRAFPLFSREKTVVKIPRSNPKIEEEVRNQLQEADIHYSIKLNQISRENIATIHSIVSYGFNLYITVMPQYEMDFFDYLFYRNMNNNPLTDKEKINLTRQLIEILETLQQAGVSHRDIKLENFLVDKKGTLKLIDFEFVCEANSRPEICPGSIAYTHLGFFTGKAPLQTNKIDYWGVGCTLWPLMFDLAPPPWNEFVENREYGKAHDVFKKIEEHFAQSDSPLGKLFLTFFKLEVSESCSLDAAKDAFEFLESTLSESSTLEMQRDELVLGKFYAPDYFEKRTRRRRAASI